MEEEPRYSKVLCKQRATGIKYIQYFMCKGQLSRSHDSSEVDNVAKCHDQVTWC